MGLTFVALFGVTVGRGYLQPPPLLVNAEEEEEEEEGIQGVDGEGEEDEDDSSSVYVSVRTCASGHGEELLDLKGSGDNGEFKLFGELEIRSWNALFVLITSF